MTEFFLEAQAHGNRTYLRKKSFWFTDSLQQLPHLLSVAVVSAGCSCMVHGWVCEL